MMTGEEIIPDFVTFADLGNGQGQLRIAPEFGDREIHSIRITATDDGDGGGPANVLSDEFVFNINVTLKI